MSGKCWGSLLWFLVYIIGYFNLHINVIELCGRDEEYDTGKKKKIKMKEESYGGPNPFQLYASKKITETKKKLTQRMNTAKTAFRI